MHRHFIRLDEALQFFLPGARLLVTGGSLQYRTAPDIFTHICTLAICVTVLTPILRNIIVTAIFGLGLFLQGQMRRGCFLVSAEGYGPFHHRVKKLFSARRNFQLLPAPLLRSFGSGGCDKSHRRDCLSPGTNVDQSKKVGTGSLPMAGDHARRAGGRAPSPGRERSSHARTSSLISLIRSSASGQFSLERRRRLLRLRRPE